jgi:metallo-beta-lactamase family protein
VAEVVSHGGAGEVTGSCHLVSHGNTRLLLDCGMHQGGDAISRMRQEKFAFRPASIDAVVLSHAHLDHSGLLPRLVREGFRGVIYCTEATRNLLAIMLEDAANIYFRDIESLNKRRKRSGRRLEKPRYDMDDVLKVLRQCRPLAYDAWNEIVGGMRVRLRDAGHILGSAVVELRLREGDGEKALVYSGDLGNRESLLLPEPALPERADVLLMESTYGNRDHRPLADTLVELEEIIDKAAREGGSILMPAFAVGRTQELLFHLGVLHHQGRLDGWQIFLDSPMAIEVTRVYDAWLDAFDDQEQAILNHYGARSLEAFLPGLKLTASAEQSMQINRLDNRVIIIAGSGMCTGGRIRHHFKHRIWRENTHVVFAGFQARGTLGRRLVDGEPYIRMFGERFVVRARIHTLGGFSAHAARSELRQWAAAVPGEPLVRLVHGEPEALETMRDCLEADGLRAEVAIPGEVRVF